jgi:hypothetical protein
MGISYLKVTAETGKYGSGTGAPTISTEPIKANSVDFTVDRGAMKEETTDSYLYNTIYGGALNISGTIETNLRPAEQAPLLAALLGTISTKTYDIEEPTAACLAIGKKSGTATDEHLFYGVGVKSAEFTFESKEFVKVKYDWLAADMVDGSYDATVSYGSEKPLVFWRASLTMAGGGITVKSCTLTIDRALDEEQFVLGSFKRNKLVRTGITDVSGTLTFTESELSELQRAYYGTTTGVAMPATNDLGTGDLVITCLQPDGTAGAVFTVPISYISGAFTSSSVDELEKTVEFNGYGTGFSLEVA